MTEDKKLVESVLTPKMTSSAKPAFKDNPDFTGIMQNKPVNDIARLNSRNSRPGPLASTLLKSGGIEASVSNAKIGARYTAQQAIFFDYTLSQYAKMDVPDGTVTYSVSQYMADRNVKDRKSAKKQIDNGLTALLQTTVSYSGDPSDSNSNKRVDTFDGMNIVSSARRLTNGNVFIRFTPEFNEIITTKGMYMPYPSAIFTINTKRHPHIVYIIRKMTEQKRISHGRPNENRLKIGTLLKAIPSLPSYEEVRKSNGAIYDRIIEPFFRDLGETPQVQQIFDYSFINPEGQPFTTDDYGGKDQIDYATFINSMLVVTWKSYPDDPVSSWKAPKPHYIDQAKKKK